MTLREIEETELPDLLRLYAHLHESDLPIPSQSIVDATWSAIQENADYHCFGLFQDGGLVATCNLNMIPNLTRGCRPYGLIENVVTHPDFRRRGFGKAVLRYALEVAWGKGCYKVMLLTGRMNEATFQFYESVGFSRHEKQAFVAKPPSNSWPA